jgi:hypothetical protein
VTTPTKSAFLAAYEKELREFYDGSPGLWAQILAAASDSINSTGMAVWFPTSQCTERAWHAIGMTGEPTIEALRRLEP